MLSSVPSLREEFDRTGRGSRHVSRSNPRVSVLLHPSHQRDSRVDEAHRGIEDDRGIRHKKRLNYGWAATTLWVVSGATVVLGAFLLVIILGFGSLW